MLAYLQRRRAYVGIALALCALVAVLLIASSSLPDYGKNLSLNLGADLIGTILVLFAVSPFLTRADGHRDSVRENFDRGAIMQRIADSRGEVKILELWTDLLQESYRAGFLDALAVALRQGVTVRILLLSPDGHAAEQRADDLLRQTNVVGDILDNLRILYEFAHRDLPNSQRGNFQVRVYSALPPVQMYQIDTQLIVSFYPVDVTSWNAMQYLTSPDSQLGKFVGDKFDELWRARSTRGLEEFWATTIVISSGAEEKSYQVPFVTADDRAYISGHLIVADHAERGIAGLVARAADDFVAVAGVRGPLSLVSVDAASTGHAVIGELFRHKYGTNDHVILELVVDESSPRRLGS